jgi:hypothetical protein
MDVEKEIYSLSADTLAYSTILAQVFWQISQTSPEMHTAISRGFDDAANVVEHLAISYGTRASPEQTVKALRVVEELRTATLGN